VTGRPIRVTLLVADNESRADADEKPEKSSAGRRPVLADQDEFVQKAIAVFGATVVKVDGIPGPTDGKG
jgi:hypothetical protein